MRGSIIIVLFLPFVFAGCGDDTNHAPVADAGPDQNIATGALVTLDGSASSDRDGDALRYSWSLVDIPAGSGAALSSAVEARPTFTVDVEGAYQLDLVVSDGRLESPPDRMTVTASFANNAPVADAGTDQSVLTGSPVTFDGSASSDADQDTLTYDWSLLSRPEGSSASLPDSTRVSPTFTPDLDGNYVFQLIVNDGNLDSAPDTVTVIAATANSAPVADAGPDQNVPTGSPVTFDGSASSDADQDTLTYDWSLLSRPEGSSASLPDSTRVSPTFTPDLDGNYVFQLIVNDGNFDSTPDTITVTAATANSAPVADAGPDRDILTGNLVTLDASGSNDADQDTLTYDWSVVSRPEGSSTSLPDTSLVNPTFTPDLAGDYVFRLIVNDGDLDSAADSVTITATTPALILSGHWTEPTQLQGDVGQYNHRPRVAINSAGSGVVGWGQRTSSEFWANATLANLFDRNSELWGDAVTLSIGADDVGYDSGSAVGIDDDGNAMVARMVKPESGADRMTVYSYDAAAGDWNLPVILTPQNEAVTWSCDNLNPKGHMLGMNKAGHSIVAWEQPCVSSYGQYINIYASLYDPETDVWSQGWRLDTSYYSNAVLRALAIGDSGQAVIAWVHDPPDWSGAPAEGLYSKVYNATSGNWTWSTLALDVSATGSIREVELCIDPAGNANAVWSHGENLFWARYDALMQSWSAPFQLDQSDDPFNQPSSGEPAIACDAGGNVLVTWKAVGSSGRVTLVSRRYHQATATWEPVTTITDAFSAANNKKVGADGQGNAIAVYMSHGYAYASRFNAETGIWRDPELLVDSGSIGLNNVDLAVGRSGETLFTWVMDPDGAGPLYWMVFARRLTLNQ